MSAFVSSYECLFTWGSKCDSDKILVATDAQKQNNLILILDDGKSKSTSYSKVYQPLPFLLLNPITHKKILNAEYNLPDFLSEDAKDMIAKIFNTDPNKRINIDQIRKHPWYQIHKPETPSFHVCPPNIQVQRSDIIQK